MLQTLKKLFSASPRTEFKTMVKEGALILDVRSKGEFAGGHIKNALNIPVNELSNNLSKLRDKHQCIICCCASGMRSGTAKRMLEAKGYTADYNGGSWQKLQNECN